MARPVSATAPPVPNVASGVGLLAQRTLLGQVIRDGLPPITYLDTPSFGRPVFYEAALSLITGHRKNGKTMVAGSVIKDRIEAGVPVLYLDFENGKNRIARRLEDMGLDPEAIDESLIYVTMPQVALGTLYQELRAILSEYPGLLIVIDSWRGLVSMLGSEIPAFSHNDSLHIDRVFGPLRNIVTQDAATVIVLDHPAKTTTENSVYAASNSVAKESVVDAIYWVQEEEPYSVEIAGSLSIQVRHDRDGRLTREKLYYRLGGQGDDGVLTFVSAEKHEVGTVKSMSRSIEEWLATSAPSADGAKTLREIRDAVTGDNGAVGTETQRLANDPDSPIQATEHRRNPRYYATGPARSAAPTEAAI